MRPAENSTQNDSDTIKIIIGRFGREPQEHIVSKDTTVEGALSSADIDFENGNVFVNGQRAESGNVLDDGDVINIVTSKQGGN